MIFSKIDQKGLLILDKLGYENPMSGSFDILHNSSCLRSGALLALGDKSVLLAQGPWQRSETEPFGKAAFFAPKFFADSEPMWWIPKKYCQMNLEELSVLSPGVSAPELYWQEPDYRCFQQDFTKIQNWIGNKRLQKIVPVVFAQSTCQMDLGVRVHLLNQVINCPEELLAYGLWQETWGILGATPEMLFQIHSDHKVSSVAVAATRSIKDSSSLQADEKQMHEHRLVIKGIFERLSEFGQVEFDKTFEKPAGRLVHLVTPVHLKTRERPSVTSLLNALHPTPALGVYPRSGKNSELLKEVSNPMLRSRFGAPFGFKWPDGRAFCLVAIRNVQWQDDSILLGSGCGIVEQSNCQTEWEELQNKRQAVREVFCL